MDRPQTTVILAMTADGKIADKKRSPARFGSSADKAHLERQVSLVDGVIFGAETLRAYGTTLTITNSELLQQRQTRKQPLQPVHIVCSASGKLDRQLRFFSQPVSRWLLTTPSGGSNWQEKAEFAKILVTSKTEEIEWAEVLPQLLQLGINKLAILGGGELIASLLAVDAIDEFWLTICPFILGGKNAPTPVAGIGLSQQQARRLKLISCQQIEQEILLHYRF